MTDDEIDALKETSELEFVRKDNLHHEVSRFVILEGGLLDIRVEVPGSEWGAGWITLNPTQARALRDWLISGLPGVKLEGRGIYIKDNGTLPDIRDNVIVK